MRQAIGAGLMAFGFACVMTTAGWAVPLTGTIQDGARGIAYPTSPETGCKCLTLSVRDKLLTQKFGAIRLLAVGEPWTGPDILVPAQATVSELLPGDAAVVSGLDGPNARLPLRNRPSRDGAVIARLPDGTPVTILGEQGVWYHVTTGDGEIGWLRGRFLESAQGVEGLPLPDDQQWTTWSNPRFGMTIDYPSALFRPEPAPENGDGQSFIGPDDRSGFFVFGQWNAMDLSLEELHEMDLGTGVFGTVTQDQLLEDSYVISGHAEGRITYRHALMPPPGDLLYVFEIGYPVAEAETFSDVVERMSASFRIAGRYEERIPSPQVLGTPPESGQDLIRDLLVAQFRELLEQLP